MRDTQKRRRRPVTIASWRKVRILTGGNTRPHSESSAAIIACKAVKSDPARKHNLEF